MNHKDLVQTTDLIIEKIAQTDRTGNEQYVDDMTDIVLQLTKMVGDNKCDWSLIDDQQFNTLSQLWTRHIELTETPDKGQQSLSRIAASRNKYVLQHMIDMGIVKQ